MSVSKTYFTPGPSQVYFTLEDHLKSALKEQVICISHRGAAFQDIFRFCREQLTILLDLPEGYDIYFTSSANEIWERIVQNLIKDSSHHFVNGSFSEKFHQFALDYQKNSTANAQPFGDHFESLDIPGEAELISVTLNETSIGYGFPIDDIRTLRDAHPDKLISVDGVSAFPAVGFDFSLADTAYFSVQKCFGLPAGLGVWIVNQKCYEKADQLLAGGISTGSYHSLQQLQKMGVKNQTPETPNILGIYLLGKVAEDMNRRGAKQIQNDTIYKSTVLYEALKQSQGIKPFVPNQRAWSKTVVVANCQGGNTAILKDLDSKGIILGKGYGAYKADHIRIANFPVHSREHIEIIADTIKKY